MSFERVTIGPHTLYRGDAGDVMRTLPDSSVDLIATDPPYFGVKSDDWDNQWETDGEFVAWLGTMAEQWHRVLKPNGSLYCFASPRMAARVECEIGKRFCVLNNIVWAKRGRSNHACKEDLRAFFPDSERIIFAEHFNSDNMAKGEAGYAARCDELRGFVFEPLRAYLDGERVRAGFDRKACDDACGNQMSGHYFSRVQWTLPTRANYEKLRAAFNAKGGEYLRREYEYLRREYEDLRREYEDLRRPFSVTADVPYTDVWTFPTVNAYPGKHPCEKPLAMMEHIVKASSRPGAVVLDCFAGSGTTGVACHNTGRVFVGVERDDKHFRSACRRIEKAMADDALPLLGEKPAQLQFEGANR